MKSALQQYIARYTVANFLHKPIRHCIIFLSALEFSFMPKSSGAKAVVVKRDNCSLLAVAAYLVSQTFDCNMKHILL